MMLIESIHKKLAQILHKPSKRHIALGLDIGSFSIKLVRTEIESDTYKLTALGLEEIKNGNVKDAIKAALDKTAVKEKQVNVGLSGKQIVIRCVILPDMDDAVFKSSMKYEAAKHIPFPINEVILDSCILRHNMDNNKMLVLIVAAKKDFIEKRLKVISDLGLEPCVLDIDSLALINIFNLVTSSKKQGVGGISAVLNIGSHLSNLALLEGDLLRFSRDIAFGGSDITQRISKELGVDFNEAERKKMSLPKPPEASSLIESSLLALVGELRLSFDYYESQTGKAVNCVYLSGGGSRLGEIDKFMQNAMNISFKAWNPFAGLDLNEHLDEGLTGQFAPCFAVATGLALR